MKAQFAAAPCLALLLGLGSAAAYADSEKHSGDVVITPLGAVEGEFCALDRAMIFEDPTGVRILIQPGRTVSGSDDPRLGDVHVILLDHTHGDHIGDRIDIACDGSGGTSLAPTGIPNVAEIAAFKNSAMLVGGEMAEWLQNRTSAALGMAVGGCGASGLTNLTEVNRSSPCADVLRPGASRELQLDGEPTGIEVSTVAVPHSNGIPAPFVDGTLPFGLTGYAGTETGYVIRFSNGLSVFWTGDSGFSLDMQLFSRFYDVDLAVVHIGDIFTMGPDEAAFAVNKLIKPRTAIVQHANEVATSGGVVNPGTRTESFIQQSRKPTIVPLSGVPIACGGQGKCTQ
jgi:L-ascorbate metabolism protein UlaG (beta-lactamase superfamily)